MQENRTTSLLITGAIILTTSFAESCLSGRFNTLVNLFCFASVRTLGASERKFESVLPLSARKRPDARLFAFGVLLTLGKVGV